MACSNSSELENEPGSKWMGTQVSPRPRPAHKSCMHQQHGATWWYIHPLCSRSLPCPVVLGTHRQTRSAYLSTGLPNHPPRLISLPSNPAPICLSGDVTKLPESPYKHLTTPSIIQACAVGGVSTPWLSPHRARSSHNLLPPSLHTRALSLSLSLPLSLSLGQRNPHLIPMPQRRQQPPGPEPEAPSGPAGRRRRGKASPSGAASRRASGGAGPRARGWSGGGGCGAACSRRGRASWCLRARWPGTCSSGRGWNRPGGTSCPTAAAEEEE